MIQEPKDVGNKAKLCILLFYFKFKIKNSVDLIRRDPPMLNLLRILGAKGSSNKETQAVAAFSFQKVPKLFRHIEFFNTCMKY